MIFVFRHITNNQVCQNRNLQTLSQLYGRIAFCFLKPIPTIRLSYTILHFGVCDYVIKVQFLIAVRLRMLQLVLKTLLTESDTSKWTIVYDCSFVWCRWVHSVVWCSWVLRLWKADSLTLLLNLMLITIFSRVIYPACYFSHINSSDILLREDDKVIYSREIRCACKRHDMAHLY